MFILPKKYHSHPFYLFFFNREANLLHRDLYNKRKPLCRNAHGDSLPVRINSDRLEPLLELIVGSFAFLILHLEENIQKVRNGVDVLVVQDILVYFSDPGNGCDTRVKISRVDKVRDGRFLDILSLLLHEVVVIFSSCFLGSLVYDPLFGLPPFERGRGHRSCHDSRCLLVESVLLEGSFRYRSCHGHCFRFFKLFESLKFLLLRVGW